MKKVAIMLGLVAGLTHVGYSNAAAPVGDAQAGEGQSMVCSACHGADGNSAVPSFPKLAGQGERYLLKQL